MNFKKTPLGIESGNTRHFNFSSKKRLTDPFKTFYQGQLISHSIETWIKTDVKFLYDSVYEKHHIELAKDSMDMFKDHLKLQFPFLFNQIEERRKMYRQKEFK